VAGDQPNPLASRESVARSGSPLALGEPERLSPRATLCPPPAQGEPERPSFLATLIRLARPHESCRDGGSHRGGPIQSEHLLWQIVQTAQNQVPRLPQNQVRRRYQTTAHESRKDPRRAYQSEAGDRRRPEAGLSKASSLFGRLCKLFRVRSPDWFGIRSADVTRRLHLVL
jgi:hypothetical protein